jgi:hypothetical protein
MARPPHPSRPIKADKVWKYVGGGRGENGWITVPKPKKATAKKKAPAKRATRDAAIRDEAPKKGGKTKSEVDALAEQVANGELPPNWEVNGTAAKDLPGGNKGKPIGGQDRGAPAQGYYADPNDVSKPLNFGFGNVTAENVAKIQASAAAGSHAAAGSYYGTNASVPARYFSGDDDEVMATLYGTEDYVAVQAALKASGIWGPRTKYQQGGDLAKTTEGLREAMAQANSLGVTWQDLLFGDAQSLAAGSGGSGGGGSGGGGGGGDSSGGPLYDPEEIRQAVDKTGQEQAGRNIDPVAREQIVAQVMAEAAAAEAEGRPYDISSEIARRTKERTPGDVALHNTFNVFDNFAKHLGAGELLGSGGAGTGLTPVATGAGMAQ